MIQKTLTSFDLKQIADSGQCFRMLPAEEANTYTVISGPHFLKAAQDGQTVTFFCEPEELPFWERYFDLDTDYDAFRKAINPRDAYLKQAADFGQGVRILRQDLWEMIITFLISQQNNISRIRGCVERLCEAYGEKKTSEEKEYYAFPTPEQLAGASEENLRKLGMGYRARYIVETTRSILDGEISLERIYRFRYYRRAKQELMKLSGVGEKVADCICLFALHHMDAFPVDTHIRQVLDEHYRRGFPNRRYHGVRGIMQQYIFYYELNKN